MRTRVVVAAATVIALLATGGCGRWPGGGADGSTAEDPWSGPAMRYGLAPVPHPDVTYQPDVVIVAGGGRSIKSVTADGLTWRIDGRADRADDLAVGKVMFVTGRAVGRVLHLHRDGDDLLATIGPVNLTDVIRNGTFAGTGISLDDPIAYQAGEPFWSDPDEMTAGTPPEGSPQAGPQSGPESSLQTGAPTGPTGSPTGRFGRSVPLPRELGRGGHQGFGRGGHQGLRRAAPPPVRPEQPPPTRGREVQTVDANFFKGVSLTDGADLGFYYYRNGVKLAGRTTLTFDNKVDAGFHLDIRDGSVTRADLTVGGGFGIKVAFEAGIQDGQNIRAVLPVPVEFSFPIGTILGVPLSLTVSQWLKVTTAFGAKVGTIRGSGEFSLAGSLGFGYANGTFGPQVTTNVKRKQSLIDSLTGVPVGVMGLLIEHGVTFTVGFSAFVLKAGVFFDLSTAYGATLGSSLGAVGGLGSHFVECRGVGLGVWASYGVGYRILEPVARAIDQFLSLLNVDPIQAEGKIGPPPYKVWAKNEITPDIPLCTPPKPA